MIENMDEAVENSFCGRCERQAWDCRCTRVAPQSVQIDIKTENLSKDMRKPFKKAAENTRSADKGQKVGSDPDVDAKIHRRINPAFQNTRLDTRAASIREVRAMHEQDIVAFMRIGTHSARMNANALLEMNFFEVLARLEEKLATEQQEQK